MKILRREEIENNNIIFNNSDPEQGLYCFTSPRHPSGGIYPPRYVGHHIGYNFDFPVNHSDPKEEEAWVDVWNKNHMFFVKKNDEFVPRPRGYQPISENTPPSWFSYNFKTDKFKLPHEVDIANEK